MAIICLSDQGARLHKKGNNLVLKTLDGEQRTILSKDIEQLQIYGNISLTAQVIKFLMFENIDTIYLTQYGDYIGRLIGRSNNTIHVRKNQFEFLRFSKNRLSCAKEFVSSKLKNCSFLIYKRNIRVHNSSCTTIMKKLRYYAFRVIGKANSLEELRGYEGSSTKEYFSVIKHLIKNTEFTFEKRTKYPPKDEVNALMSFSYTTLFKIVSSRLYSVGLDPYYGSLHDIEFGRESLVLDLMEEFRPFMDDAVLTMMNKKIIQKRDFQYDVKDDDGKIIYPVALSPDALKKTIRFFHSYCCKKFEYENIGKISLYNVIFMQCRKMARTVNKIEPYTGFEWRRSVLK